MFAASTYDEIESIEKRKENLEIVVLLFVKPNTQYERDIIREFEYIHYNAGKYCTVFAIGYTKDFCNPDDKTKRRIEDVINGDWYFCMQDYVEFKNKLEGRIKWEYSGETEILILQNNPMGNHSLNFTNYVAINVNKGIREGYIDSFQRFMESLIRCSRKEVTAKGVICAVRKHQICLSGIISEAIDDCKKIPSPVKKIIKDRLFYRCANSLRI